MPVVLLTRFSDEDAKMPIEIQPVQPDRSKIVLDDETVVRHWTKVFGASKEEIGVAMEKVGNNPDTVRKELARISEFKKARKENGAAATE